MIGSHWAAISFTHSKISKENSFGYNYYQWKTKVYGLLKHVHFVKFCFIKGYILDISTLVKPLSQPNFPKKRIIAGKKINFENNCSLFVCLLLLLSHSRIFTHMETSPLPVKGCKFWPMLSTHGHWAVRVL